MTAKIVAFSLTLFINIVIGVVVFFFLLLTMNGYSESDANYGLAGYAVCGLAVSVLMAFCAARIVSVMMKRKFSGISAGFVAVPIFSVVGGGLKLVCAIIGIAIAEYIRRH